MYDILSQWVCGGVEGNHRPVPPSPPMAHPRDPPPHGAPSRGVTLRGPHSTEPHHGAHGASPRRPRSLTTEPLAHGGSPRGAVDAPPAGPGPRLPSSDPDPATGTPLSPGQETKARGPLESHTRASLAAPSPPSPAAHPPLPTPDPPAQQSFRARSAPTGRERRRVSPPAHRA